MRATGRRAALVAAFVGLLLTLTSGSATAAVAPARHLLSGAASGAAVPDATSAISTPSTGVVSDGVRPARSATARTSGLDRAPESQSGGWAVMAWLLVLAAGARSLGLRHAAGSPPRTAWRRATAPRAPPALAFC
jgi:hypothetical protein